MAANTTKMLVISANVGSIFEDFCDHLDDAEPCSESVEEDRDFLWVQYFRRVRNLWALEETKSYLDPRQGPECKLIPEPDVSLIGSRVMYKWNLDED